MTTGWWNVGIFQDSFDHRLRQCRCVTVPFFKVDFYITAGQNSCGSPKFGGHYHVTTRKMRDKIMEGQFYLSCCFVQWLSCYLRIAEQNLTPSHSES